MAPKSQSIVVSQNLNPLIGGGADEVGVTLEERYNRRRTQTLKQSAQQILEQSDKSYIVGWAIVTF